MIYKPSRTHIVIKAWSSRGGKYWVEIRQHADDANIFDVAFDNGAANNIRGREAAEARAELECSFMPSKMRLVTER